MDRKIKYTSRKDIRERMNEEECRQWFLELMQARQKRNLNDNYFTNEKIEIELRKIYDSPLEFLSLEDESGILLFGKTEDDFKKYSNQIAPQSLQ